MLVLTRGVEQNDTICIGTTSDGVIEIVVTKIKDSGRVRIGVRAPSHCPVVRKELLKSGSSIANLTPFSAASLPPTGAGVYRTADNRLLCAGCIDREVKAGRIKNMLPIEPVNGPLQICNNMLPDSPDACNSGICVNMSVYN